ncbi:MAG: hypothetical protein HQL87_09395 [Magnetococcales bacterium]|nr:hypothetical protein [Magnetococcales bacterium]
MQDWKDEAFKTLFSHIKTRNSFLDAWFYDVGALTRSEWSVLNPLVERQGSIVVVSPAQANQNGQFIRHYEDTKAFLASKDHPAKAVILAGVGSSVLGTAALARNVANVYQMDVVGVVTGYGMADVTAEALGGCFFYGAADQARLEYQEFLKQFPQTDWMLKIARSTTQEWNKLPLLVPPGDQDTETLLELLTAQTGDLRLLLGHSKGSLIISYVLNKFVHNPPHPCLKNLQVVTLSTVSDLPAACQHKQQFIGDIDWFGGMNSRIGIPRTIVPNAWHHTNTNLPYHLPVEEVLKGVPLL